MSGCTSPTTKGVSPWSEPSTAAPGSGSEPAATVVFLTHTLDGEVVRRYRRLVRETPPDHEVRLAVDVEAGERMADTAREIAGSSAFPFRFGDLPADHHRRPWAGDNATSLVPGNVALLLLHLARSRPPRDHWWLIEYDVAYTGHWRTFFEHFRSNDADLLGTTLQPRSNRPDFHWWDSFEAPEPLRETELLRGLFPVMRLSRTALRIVDRVYAEGWSGHHEVVLPTSLRDRGRKIEDIGGEGPFVSAGNENRFYTNTPGRTGLAPGTFVYRPARRWPGLRPDTLWHPVKPTAGRLAPYLKLARIRLARWMSAGPT